MCRESIKVTDGEGFGETLIVGGLDAMMEETQKAGVPLVWQFTWGPSMIGGDEQIWLDAVTLQAIADAMPDLSGAI